MTKKRLGVIEPENPMDPDTFDPMLKLYQPADLRRIADPMTLYTKGIEYIITRRSQSNAWNWSDGYQAHVNLMFGRIRRELARRRCPLRQARYEQVVSSETDPISPPSRTDLERQEAAARQKAVVAQIMARREEREKAFRDAIKRGEPVQTKVGDTVVVIGPRPDVDQLSFDDLPSDDPTDVPVDELLRRTGRQPSQEMHEPDSGETMFRNDDVRYAGCP